MRCIGSFLLSDLSVIYSCELGLFFSRTLSPCLRPCLRFIFTFKFGLNQTVQSTVPRYSLASNWPQEPILWSYCLLHGNVQISMDRHSTYFIVVMFVNITWHPAQLRPHCDSVHRLHFICFLVYSSEEEQLKLDTYYMGRNLGILFPTVTITWLTQLGMFLVC